MSKKLNKKSMMLIGIFAIAIAASLYINLNFGITVLFVLLFCYLLICNAYLIKVYKGAKAYKIDEFETALQYYRSAVVSPWCNSSVIRDYLICELKHGKAFIANETIDEIFTKRTFKENDLLNLKITKAIVLWKNNKRQDAINLLKELLEKSKSTFLYETLSSLLVVNGNNYDAKTLIKEALEYNSDSNILKSNLGEVNYKLGNYDEAYKIFTPLLNENIKFVEPYYYVGLIEMNNKNFEKSKELLEIAQSLNESLVTLVTIEDVEQAYNKVVFKSFNT